MNVKYDSAHARPFNVRNDKLLRKAQRKQTQFATIWS